MTQQDCGTLDGRTPGDSEISAALDELAVSTDTNLIEVLQEVQDRFGYLPAPALQEISRRTRIPLIRVYGVVSFYTRFYTEPRGRHTVCCCRGTACYVRGGKEVAQTVQDVLGVKDGQTTGDMMFSFETAACLGACALAPVMVIDGEYRGKTTPDSAEEELKKIMAAESGVKEVK